MLFLVLECLHASSLTGAGEGGGEGDYLSVLTCHYTFLLRLQFCTIRNFVNFAC